MSWSRKDLNKEKFYIPKDQAESYDGDTLRFRISEAEAKSKFIGEYPPSLLSRQNDDFIIARKAQDIANKTNASKQEAICKGRGSHQEKTSDRD